MDAQTIQVGFKGTAAEPGLYVLRVSGVAGVWNTLALSPVSHTLSLHSLRASSQQSREMSLNGRCLCHESHGFFTVISELGPEVKLGVNCNRLWYLDRRELGELVRPTKSFDEPCQLEHRRMVPRDAKSNIIAQEGEIHRFPRV